MTTTNTPLVCEIGRDDYEWTWFQFGDGAQGAAGMPRFRPDHRVFKLAITDHARGGDEPWHRVMDWLAEHGLEVDGWTYSARPQTATGYADAPVITAAVWRFRRGQQAEAEMFSQAWVHGRQANVLAGDGTRH